jgi:hypothetical protein
MLRSQGTHINVADSLKGEVSYKEIIFEAKYKDVFSGKY